LPADFLSKVTGYHESVQFPLTVGKTYAVIGLTGFNGDVWYYVADDHELGLSRVVSTK
jgi:hypothetical protein